MRTLTEGQGPALKMAEKEEGEDLILDDMVEPLSHPSLKTGFWLCEILNSFIIQSIVSSWVFHHLYQKS